MPVGEKSKLGLTKQTKNENISESLNILTDDALEVCKCYYCKCYLSVGPIRMVDSKVACGRCKRESDGVRLLMVEAMAKSFNFPCRYESAGCKAKLKWVLVASHEKTCYFKEIYCIITDCFWFGPVSSLKFHFEQNHPSEIINSQKPIMINLQEKKVSQYLYVSKKLIFLVLLANDRKNIVHQVKFFCTSIKASTYEYRIYLYDSQKQLIFIKQKLQSFEDDIGIFNKELSIDALQTIFEDQEVYVTFAIIHSNNKDNIQKLLVSGIDCPVCLDPMLNKIIVGMCGHSVCEQCKKSLQDCPCCRNRYDDTASGITFGSPHNIRNYTLESLIKKLDQNL